MPNPESALDASALDEAREIAKRILSGKEPDPTSGATHFYSPQSMSKEGQPPRGDVAGGLESVPGVVGKDKKPIKNYRPGWALIFEQINVPGIPEKDFKFFKAPMGTSLVK